MVRSGIIVAGAWSRWLLRRHHGPRHGLFERFIGEAVCFEELQVNGVA
jgi:hypothetical protein